MQRMLRSIQCGRAASMVVVVGWFFPAVKKNSQQKYDICRKTVDTANNTKPAGVMHVESRDY